MSISSFSSLVYRIIGKPDHWHDDYIVDMLQQYLDEAKTYNDPENLTELAAGDQIISRIRQGNVALNAFNTLLDQSRFKLIILDEQLQPVYHNHNANKLITHLQNPVNPQQIKPALASLIRTAARPVKRTQQKELLALDFYDQHGDQIYLRSLQSEVREYAQPTLFHILLVLDKRHAHLQLNAELVIKYGLTGKEQDVLVRLIHGSTIKEIAAARNIAENTVKSHLKAIFSKTDCKSQATLISQVLTHEAQVLDSYFESDISTAQVVDNAANDREVRIASGHTIAYCEYGPAEGRPLIVFHSGFGSRLAIPPGYQEICERTNRRIIIPDRPGRGKTPFIEGHPENWNAHLMEFIDALGIEQYDVMGCIIASQLAVSYMAQADPRMQKVILSSPVFTNELAHTRHLREILSPASRYVRMSPEFSKEVYRLWLKSITLNIDLHYPSILQSSIGSAERQQFDDQHVVELLTNVFKEGAHRSLDGMLSEMIFCLTPLGLDLSRLTTPIEIWYGTEDKRITREGVEDITKDFPNCKLNIREGYSEHLYYALFEEIIA